MMDLVNVTKAYTQGRRSVQAVRGVDLHIKTGEFVSIMGPSGSGKSTLLHLLAGITDTPTNGHVVFQGLNLQTLSDRQRSLLRRTRIGFVFQFFNRGRSLGAGAERWPLLLGGMKRSVALEQAAASLERVSMTYRSDHYPEEMSGGEMQRVAIARALVCEPEAVLCDEPTGNLDSATSKEILTLLRKLPEAGKRSVVMVTHDRKAAEYGDRIIHIRDGLVAHEERMRGNVLDGYGETVAS